MATALTVRRLDPVGHFVSDLLDAPRGTSRLDVVAATQTGEQLQGHFSIPVR